MKRRLTTFILLLSVVFNSYSSDTNLAKDIGFVENKGQLEPDVLFYLNLSGQNIIIKQNGFSYDNFKIQNEMYQHHRVDFVYQNQSIKPIIKTGKSLNHYVNFYTDGKEINNVKVFESITILNVYSGIDIKYSVDVKKGGFKYDYILHPGANIENIKFKVVGAEVKLKHNQLEILTDLGMLIERIPVSYFAEDSEIVLVEYRKIENHIFGFKSNELNISKTLIIDPTPNLKWATYHGGSGDDAYWDIAFDSIGNFYNVGKTGSTNNMSTSGAYQTSKSSNNDALVSKFDKYGKLIWCTYYGSTGLDEAYAVLIGKDKNIVIFGYSSSTTNMATSGAHQTSNAGLEDGIIAKFSPSGSRIWSTFYGGSGNDEIYDATLDSKGDFYVVGKTGSSSGIATTGAYQTTNSGGEDAMIAKFSASGSFIWGTYLGGSAQDYVTGVTIDNNDILFIAGWAASTSNFAYNAKYQNTNGGSGDAFVGRLSTNGKMDWVNYFGGSGKDYAIRVEMDDSNNVILTGTTFSSNKIATTGADQTTYGGNGDGFLSKFDSSGNIIWATYSGSSGEDEIYQLVFIEGNIYCVGKTTSTTGIATTDVYQTSNKGGFDVSLFKYTNKGSKTWGSYYGGAGDDMSRGIGWYNYQLFILGVTSSNSNIATTGSHQTSFGGSTDAFIAVFGTSSCELIPKVIATPKCYRDSLGAAAVLVKGALGTINYKWNTSPPQYTDTAWNLPKGVYQVVVSDSFGCNDSIKVTINEPDKLNAFVRDSLHISCAGKKDGRLIAGYSGGTSPVSYSWNTTPLQNYDTAIGLAKGLYKVKIKDANGCIDSAAANIIEPDTLTSKIAGFKNASCFLLNDGQIDVIAYGGTLPYYYSWSTSPVQTTSSAFNITAGYYEVLIKDKRGCTTKNGYTITEPSPVTIGTTNLENCLCFNDSNGQIFTKVWGGTPGYKITWNTTPISTELNLKRLRGGTYRLTIVDTLNCVTTKNFTILEPPPIVIKFDSIKDVLCKNGNSGSVYAQIAGGSPAYSIFWNSAPISNQNKLTNLRAGFYKITVKDSMSCQLIDSVKINEPDSIIISGIAAHIQCNGNNSGEIKTTVTGGLAPYTFVWAHDTAINKPNLNQLKAGNYLLTIKDKNNCTSNKQFVLSEPSPIEIYQQLVKPIACHNGTDGRLSVSINGGTPPLKLIWNTTPQSYTLSIDSLKAGFYTATVVDAFGCSDSLSIQINEPKQLVGYFDSVVSPSCYKKLDGSSTYKVIGGTKPYIYSFDNAPFQNDSLVYKIGAGFVRVKIIDAKGCVLIDSNQLFHPAELKSDALLENISCFGLSDGRIILNTEGGVKPYKYLWSHNTKDTSTAFGLNKGYYYLSILDKNNCILKDTFSITEPDKLLAQIDITLPATCFNGSDGLASGKALGGTKPYYYFWTGLSNQNSQIAKNLRAGNYTLFVKDANGCLDSTSTQIGRPEKVKAIISSSKKPTCELGSDGEATATPIPGVGPYSYLWSNGTNLANAQGLKKGNYSVIITDACGDTAMAHVQIDDPAPFIIPNITGYIIAKKGTIETYSIKENNNWTYLWEIENGEIVGGQGTHTVSIKWATSEKGTIKVTITNELGCVDDNSLSISLFDECMLVFPNPSSSKTSVFIPFYDPSKNLELFDAKGSKLFSESSNKINAIDVSHLARGVYIFRYESCRIKFLKE